MKLGLGLYRHMLTPDNFRFARQAGATHIIAHWVDYFQGTVRIPESDANRNWGVIQNQGKLWTYEELRDLKITNFLISEMPTDKMVYGLYGIEDFLSDGIIHLKVEQAGDSTNLYLGVVKMRKTHHPRNFFPLLYETDHFEIVTQ